MAGASQSIIINATPKKVFGVVSDFESYPEYLPETRGVTVEARKGTTAVVSFTINVIKTIQYTLKFKLEAPKRLSWVLVRADLFKTNKGSWVLEPLDGGKSTKATYSIEVDFGLLVPGAITKMLVGSNLPKMMARIKERAESLA